MTQLIFKQNNVAKCCNVAKQLCLKSNCVIILFIIYYKTGKLIITEYKIVGDYKDRFCDYLLE